MSKQVDADHYRFERYMSIARWNSMWFQLQQLMKLTPDGVLEVGPGPGMFKAVAGLSGIRVETVDLDPELSPDHIGSATALPLPDAAYDVTCAFQVLEHLPFDDALVALDEMARVARRHVLISLPDARRTWRYSIHLPRWGERHLLINRPQRSAPVHVFDGEHHWEVNKRGYALHAVIEAFQRSGRLRLESTFRPYENPMHRFFLFAKEGA